MLAARGKSHYYAWYKPIWALYGTVWIEIIFPDRRLFNIRSENRSSRCCHITLSATARNGKRRKLNYSRERPISSLFAIVITGKEKLFPKKRRDNSLWGSPRRNNIDRTYWRTRGCTLIRKPAVTPSVPTGLSLFSDEMKNNEYLEFLICCIIALPICLCELVIVGEVYAYTQQQSNLVMHWKCRWLCVNFLIFYSGCSAIRARASTRSPNCCRPFTRRRSITPVPTDTGGTFRTLRGRPSPSSL